MIALEHEMIYREEIEGPLGPTEGSPLGNRLCWQVVSGTLIGDRFNAHIAMPGIAVVSIDTLRPGRGHRSATRR